MINTSNLDLVLRYEYSLIWYSICSLQYLGRSCGCCGEQRRNAFESQNAIPKITAIAR
jgi:hypothetical protein